MKMSRVSTIALLTWLLIGIAEAAVSVQNLRQWRAPDHTRLVFDLSGPLEHRVFTLENPLRVVVDMDAADIGGPLPELDFSGPLLAGLRTGKPEPGVFRVVLDLKAQANARTFVLKPYGQYGHRLVIDLYDVKQQGEAREASPPRESRAAPREKRTIIVAIDAGHGGEDPGAIGRRYKTYEKDVTLSIARELARQIDRTPGMRAVLIRDGDYYIGLQDRFLKARKQRADVFLSIHADAVPGRQAHGSSVYALSEKGATDAMARLLADRENASDLIGGVTLNDKDDLLAKVLLDLSQTKTIHDSLALGEDLLSELKTVGPVHFDSVRQAGFAVLKAPDIPSVLVETAFISNPSEERKLRSAKFQREMASGLLRGIKRFIARQRFDDTAPVTAAVREHVVQPGETLSRIAAKYEVDVNSLRVANNLRSEPMVGSRLQIP